MSKRWFVATYRLALGAGVIMAIIAQIGSMSARPTFNVVNFFSFFTILSNCFAAGIFLLGGVWLAFNRPVVTSAGYDLTRGAATVYMVVTGIVYATLLSGNEVSLQTTVPWVNVHLHYIMPLAVALDWLLVPPRTRLRLAPAAVWLIYPLVYVVYSLLRGPLVGWYPYPFLNPETAGGYVGVAAYSAGILVTILVMSLATLGLGNLLRTRRWLV